MIIPVITPNNPNPFKGEVVLTDSKPEGRNLTKENDLSFQKTARSAIP